MKHSDLGAKNKQSLSQNCAKSTKMATAVCEFSKLFWGSMSPDPPRAFFIVNIYIRQNNSAQNNTLENMANWGTPYVKEFLEYVTDMKAFLKGFLCLFWV